MSNVILKSKGRSLARDAKEEYSDPHELLEGGLDALEDWCSENLASADIQKLIDSLSVLLHHRTLNTLKGAMDSTRDAEAEFRKMFPDARALVRG